MDKLYCNYQTSTFAKCVKASERENFASDPPHECGDVGAQCMGDKEFVANLGEGRTGRCCAKGLACVFQAPYVGLCADPNHYIYADAFPQLPDASATDTASVSAPTSTATATATSSATDTSTPAEDQASLPGLLLIVLVADCNTLTLHQLQELHRYH